ncbi:hypothetical protein L1887_63223 [Cichorium endivia]|nr:hypothetical protein L1887_63223 [Cichorium endivia]
MLQSFARYVVSGRHHLRLTVRFDLRLLECQLKQRWMTLEMDDNRWYAYAMEHNLPLPNFQNSSASSSKADDKFTYKTRGTSEPLSSIKDQKSESSGSTSSTIKEHPEN